MGTGPSAELTFISSLLAEVALPRMIRVRQVFADDALPDVEAALRAELSKPAIADRLRPGASIAVGVGSRGLAELPLLARTVIDELKKAGARPFIVPAMGSHGGATADGQAGMLAALGVTEESAGCPIRSSMETVELARLGNGLPVYMDKLAMEADGVVFINRVKPHTSFSGPYESGLVKMLSIGLGKQKGADSCHALGFGQMARNIVDMAEVKLAKAPILFGVATVENSYDRISQVVAVPAEEIMAVEPALLEEAKSNMPRILFTPLDVLIVDRIGKEFSGTGADPHITGRPGTPYVEPRQQTGKLAFLDLSEKTHGNATGMGLADFTTRRMAAKIDFDATYANHLTSTVTTGAKTPMTLLNDRQAIQAAVKTCNAPDLSRPRLARIPNSLHLGQIRISEALLGEARENPAIEILGEAEAWSFDAEGHLADLGADAAH